MYASTAHTENQHRYGASRAPHEQGRGCARVVRGAVAALRVGPCCGGALFGVVGIMIERYVIPATLGDFERDLRTMQVADPVAYEQLKPIYEVLYLDATRGLSRSMPDVLTIERPQ
jgi:hypothetical protein